MKRQIRREQVLKRKNFLPTLLITLLLWLCGAGLILLVDPSTFAAIPLFFVVAFTGLLFTFSLILADRRRGLIAAIALTFFLILSYLGVGNVINFLLIVAIAVCVGLYFSAK